MKPKPLNFSVKLFIGKSILHASSKLDLAFKPKSSQISCLVISSSKLPTYTFFITILRSDLWWCVWMECDISCSCDEQFCAIGGCCYSFDAICFVLWGFSLRLLDGKEELVWVRVLIVRLCGYSIKKCILGLNESRDYFIFCTKVFL